jgi:predicted nucleic acid-binding protein
MDQSPRSTLQGYFPRPSSAFRHDPGDGHHSQQIETCDLAASIGARSLAGAASINQTNLRGCHLMRNRELPMSISDPAYMLDTNVFNAVLEAVLKEDIAIEEFRGLALFVTHVQADELHATQAKDPAKAAALLGVFAQMGPEETPTRSAVWDVSACDRASWSDEDGIFGRMLLRLKIFDTASGKKPRDPNQQRDILIAETAVKNGLMLVSSDANLRRVTTEFGGSAIKLEELRARARNC